jgi:TDG/mug DNA glycosylase family protein
VAAADARILILGSMPGVASLDAVQYYAHPRNQFWKIVGTLCGQEAGAALLPYAQRLQMLQRHRLALWDVLHSCVRPGSLDAAIEHHSAAPNDLIGLLAAHPAVVRVCCNGGTAFSALRRYFAEDLARQFPHIDIHQLPSTSPANASWTYVRKLTAWQAALAPALNA